MRSLLIRWPAGAFPATQAASFLARVAATGASSPNVIWTSAMSSGLSSIRRVSAQFFGVESRTRARLAW